MDGNGYQPILDQVGRQRKELKMLRTIIEHKEDKETWEPAFPFWFGEPTDSVFTYDIAATLSQDLTDSRMTVVTERLPEYKVWEPNSNGTFGCYLR